MLAGRAGAVFGRRTRVGIASSCIDDTLDLALDTDRDGEGGGGVEGKDEGPAVGEVGLSRSKLWLLKLEALEGNSGRSLNDGPLSMSGRFGGGRLGRDGGPSPLGEPDWERDALLGGVRTRRPCRTRVERADVGEARPTSRPSGVEAEGGVAGTGELAASRAS